MKSFRKHAGWYLTGYPVGGAAAEARPAWWRRSPTSTQLLAQLDPRPRSAPNALRAPAATPTARGRSHLPDGWLDEVDDPTPPEGAELLVSAAARPGRCSERRVGR